MDEEKKEMDSSGMSKSKFKSHWDALGDLNTCKRCIAEEILQVEAGGNSSSLLEVVSCKGGRQY